VICGSRLRSPGWVARCGGLLPGACLGRALTLCRPLGARCSAQVSSLCGGRQRSRHLGLNMPEGDGVSSRVKRRRRASPATAPAESRRRQASSSRARRGRTGRGGAATPDGEDGALGNGGTRYGGGDSDSTGSDHDGVGNKVTQRRSSVTNGLLSRRILHRVALRPRASLGWLWGAILVALFAFVSVRIFTSE
jgi:hypothetical protein